MDTILRIKYLLTALNNGPWIPSSLLQVMGHLLKSPRYLNCGKLFHLNPVPRFSLNVQGNQQLNSLKTRQDLGKGLLLLSGNSSKRSIKVN